MANVSVQVSERLSSLPTSPSLTPQELNTIIEIATQLVDVAGDNVEVGLVVSCKTTPPCLFVCGRTGWQSAV